MDYGILAFILFWPITGAMMLLIVAAFAGLVVAIVKLKNLITHRLNKKSRRASTWHEAS